MPFPGKRSFPSLLAGLLCLAAFAATPPTAQANIDLVTLPPRDKSQLTIYNNEDLTLVREQRTVVLAKGANRIQFSWAGTLIDPTSLDVTFPGAPAGRYRVADVVYPPNTQNLLIWNIEAAEAGPAPLLISYFTSGLTWSADYVLVADTDEKTLRMEGWVKVTNNSGEAYENAEIRLLVGEINLVQKIAELAQGGMKTKKEASRMIMGDMVAMAEAAPAMAPKQIIKEGVSEYFLYTIEGRESIDDKWSKRLPSFSVKDIPFDVSYEFDDQKYGDQVVLFYKFKNDKDHLLGKEPLPDGQYAVYRQSKEAGLSFVNSTQLKYVPIGEDIELNLGTDGLLTIEPKLMDLERTNIEFQKQMLPGVGQVIGYDEKAKWRIEVRNSRTRAVPLKITRHLAGDWTIETKEQYEKKSKDTIVFQRSVPALSSLTIDYTFVTRNGSRAKR